MAAASDRVADILAAEQIRPFAKPIWRMSGAQLRRQFAARSSGRPLAARLLKNIIWQAHTRKPPIEGNLRSFWYEFCLEPLSRAGISSDSETLYGIFSKTFAELVGVHRLFNYADFGFDDDRDNYRKIGGRRRSTVVVAEKKGYLRTMKELHRRLGVTVTCLAGQPSLLSTEYLVRGLRARRVDLLFVVDYDPSGWMIARTFREQLAVYGVEVRSWELLIRPANFSKADLRRRSLPLAGGRYMWEKNSDWFRATGGINGKMLRIEADAMPRSRLVKRVERAVSRSALSGPPGARGTPPHGRKKFYR
jgi:hypothetical protein